MISLGCFQPLKTRTHEPLFAWTVSTLLIDSFLHTVTCTWHQPMLVEPMTQQMFSTCTRTSFPTSGTIAAYDLQGWCPLVLFSCVNLLCGCASSYGVIVGYMGWYIGVYGQYQRRLLNIISASHTPEVLCNISFSKKISILRFSIYWWTATNQQSISLKVGPTLTYSFWRWLLNVGFDLKKWVW